MSRRTTSAPAADSPTQAYRRIVETMIELLLSTKRLQRRTFALPTAMGLLAIALSQPVCAAPGDQTPVPPMAAADPHQPSAQPTPANPQPVAQAAPPNAETTTLPEVRKYCANIANAATEARFAWQTAKLNELETRLRLKVKELDAKEAELRGWMEKRETIEKEASEKLVAIYSKMRPETAASQISALDDDMAAAVLGQLGPRQASAIFNEILPDRAAKLAGMIAGTTPPDKKL